MKLACLLVGVAAVSAKTYFKEQFDSDWADRWTVSDWKADSEEAGTMALTAGKWYGDETADLGLQTSQDARFYALSSKMETFDNTDKDLVLQFSIKHEQKIDCGGGYLKIFPPALNPAKMEGDSEYNIMFGPDICGSSTKKVHVIFAYKGENKLINKSITAKTDELTHVYTLIVKPDQTYEVRVDGENVESGSLVEDWDFLEPKMIKDPEQSKPEDWVDDDMMADPEDIKPEGYDAIEEQIVDPDAEKPDDWDDEMDGEWEAPMVDNPEYKGEWNAKMIENPEYKGEWEHPEIDNPDFVSDDSIYAYEHGHVGIDIWQVKSGTIFDNIIMTDSIEEAEALMEETFTKNKEAEKAMFDEVEDARKAEEKAERDALEAEREAEEEDDDDDDDDDEDEVEEKAKDEL